MSRIIDAHLHLSTDVSPRAMEAAASLDAELAAANIERGVVLHLKFQPWSAEEFAEAMAAHPRLHGMVNVDPRDADANRQLRDAVEKLGYIGLKLHPRLQGFPVNAPEVQKLVAFAGEIGVPVLIDAFPDGDFLLEGFDARDFALLARACPATNIIVAHFGAHHCIDLMMMAKRVPNMWFDVSYSLLYFDGTPVQQNILYCCRSMRYRRVLYGSDYPDRSIEKSLAMSMKAFAAAGIEGESLEALTSGNAREIFSW